MYSVGQGTSIFEMLSNFRLKNSLRTTKDPSRPSLLGIYSPIAFLTATLREMSYPQPELFRRFVFFNPPPLGRIYVVAAYMIFILILLFKDSIVSGPMHYETIAYRAAWCSVGQIPLIVLLAMKNSVVGALIGSSYERINWLHRTVARCLLFTVTIHFSFFWREWSIYHVIESEIRMMPMVKFGLSSFFILMWIVFSSFAPIRHLSYEIFVVQHVISFIAFLVCVMIHVPRYAKAYVWIPIGIYAFDRTIRSLRLVYRNLSIFHKRSHGILSCRAHLTALPGHVTRVTIPNPPLRTWSPGEHVFLSFPTISPFQSHPFTIASSPLSPSRELTFIVRAHSGCTRRIYNRAKSFLPTTSDPLKEKSFMVLMDGPYGRIQDVRQYDTLILIAGSTGATYTVPILLHTLQSQVGCVRHIEFLWVVKAGCNIEWFASELVNAVQLSKDRGISLNITCYVTCDPTYTSNFPIVQSQCCCCFSEVPVDKLESNEKIDSASSSLSPKLCPCSCAAGAEIGPAVMMGRPDLHAIIHKNLELARGETAVVVCGPGCLMSRTRNVVAALSDERGAEKGTGAHGIILLTEGFGW